MTPETQSCDALPQRRQLCRTMTAVHQRGWCDGTGGNFSCVLQREPLQLLMAPSGVDKGAVRPAELLVVDGQGNVLKGQGRASAETLLHLEIIRQTGAGAVLHTHSQSGTLLSAWALEQSGRHNAASLELRDREMLKGLAGIVTHAQAVQLPVLANDQNLQALSQAAAPLLSQAPYGLLIAGHGLYAWGDDLATARRHLEILEFLLEQRWRALLLAAAAAPASVIRLPQPELILLDIEGTTCPVSFVSEVLFPYASSHLQSFLHHHQHEPAVQTLLREAQTAWQQDSHPQACQLLITHPNQVDVYLQWLMQQDRKLPCLKELQGMIWQEGYAQGELCGPLFADVPAALKRWHAEGLALAVYSSGSVAAQQLIYRFSNAGDLSPLFCGWFDTRSGSKLEASSYSTIANQLNRATEQILFISDSVAELDAANSAGMRTLCSCRADNPTHHAGQHAAVDSFVGVAFHAAKP